MNNTDNTNFDSENWNIQNIDVKVITESLHLELLEWGLWEYREIYKELANK